MALTKQALPHEMKLTYHMEGNVNGHFFIIKGDGVGKPYDGTHTITLHVVGDKGSQLPFSVDILSTVFQYGNRCFTEYPSNMVDYFKNSCSGGGYTFGRSFLYEDGAVCTASGDITLGRDESNQPYFDHKSKFLGVNFPADGPVMKNETSNWEPSCEKMTPSGKTLNGDVIEFLLLKNGGRYKCQFHTVYDAKDKPKKMPMPDFHFVQHKIERKDLLGYDTQTWELTEHAAACKTRFTE